jgi:phage tail-like protein
VQRKDVQILILDADGITEKVRFTLRKAWPCKFKAAELNAMASGVAILELDLCHEELVRQ